MPMQKYQFNNALHLTSSPATHSPGQMHPSPPPVCLVDGTQAAGTADAVAQAVAFGNTRTVPDRTVACHRFVADKEVAGQLLWTFWFAASRRGCRW